MFFADLRRLRGTEMSADLLAGACVFFSQIREEIEDLGSEGLGVSKFYREKEKAQLAFLCFLKGLGCAWIRR